MTNPGSKKWRFAFAGFRHGHIMGLYNAAGKHPRIEIVAACEEDAEAAEKHRKSGIVRLTHDRIDVMLKEVPCDVVAVGDYFQARGRIALAALNAGKHVIADKPLCTSLDELQQIEKIAGEKRLSVGCLLDLHGSAAARTMRRLILSGEIGTVHTVLFTAQHPLMPASRAKWYFEPGKHGGTLNDIAIHGLDAVPWMTGRRLASVRAARTWNAGVSQHPDFQNAAQFMIVLDNGGGLMGDVSYLAPDRCGYTMQQYWRFTIHGSKGVIESSGDTRPVSLATHDDASPREIPLDAAAPDIALLDFLDELEGHSQESALTTAGVLAASRNALLLQQAADKQIANVRLSSTGESQ